MSSYSERNLSIEDNICLEKNNINAKNSFNEMDFSKEEEIIERRNAYNERTVGNENIEIQEKKVKHVNIISKEKYSKKKRNFSKGRNIYTEIVTGAKRNINSGCTVFAENTTRKEIPIDINTKIKQINIDIQNKKSESDISHENIAHKAIINLGETILDIKMNDKLKNKCNDNNGSGKSNDNRAENHDNKEVPIKKENGVNAEIDIHQHLNELSLKKNIETDDDLPQFYPPEPQVGNIEYKLKIVNPSKQRFEHLVTQMKWRLREGQGEAIYEIGIEDDGKLTGVSNFELQSSLNTLRRMAGKLNASIHILRERVTPDGNKLAEVLVRKAPDDQDNIEIRIAVLGNACAGKSTLLGVLTHGELDNGRGKARLNMFRHLHEIQSGRTSSICHEILGFNTQGDPINYGTKGFITAEEICEASSKMVTFLDLAGHKKYINTTVQGLSGYSPHYAMLVISSDAGAVGMTQEHLTIAVALKVPFFIVITKTDIVSPDATISTLGAFLKQIGVMKIPTVIETLDDVITAGRLQVKQDIVPIFRVSNVTGDGLKLLLGFLHILPPSISLADKQRFDKESVEFQIDEYFTAGNIEQILGGLLLKGIISEETKLKIGPQNDGKFVDVEVKSIHRNKIPCRAVRSGQSAAICLDKIIPELRNGMVLLSNDVDACGSLYFQATISVLFSGSPLYIGSETTAHIGSIRQTVVIMGIFIGNCLQLNETSSVVFKFKQHPEFIREGQKLLLRDGVSRGTGEITQVFPMSLHPQLK